jgi:hypothetical protein
MRCDFLELIYVDIHPILSDTKVTLGEDVLHFSRFPIPFPYLREWDETAEEIHIDPACKWDFEQPTLRLEKTRRHIIRLQLFQLFGRKHRMTYEVGAHGINVNAVNQSKVDRQPLEMFLTHLTRRHHKNALLMFCHYLDGGQKIPIMRKYGDPADLRFFVNRTYDGRRHKGIGTIFSDEGAHVVVSSSPLGTDFSKYIDLNELMIFLQTAASLDKQALTDILCIDKSVYFHEDAPLLYVSQNSSLVLPYLFYSTCERLIPSFPKKNCSARSRTVL